MWRERDREYEDVESVEMWGWIWVGEEEYDQNIL